jgi:general secretion pathway protein L
VAQATSGGFFDWWLGELRALLPRRWRDTAQRRFGVVLVLERPYLRVYERRGRRLAMLGSIVLPDPAVEGTAPSIEPRLRRSIDRNRDGIVLVLGEDDALICTDVLPGAAESDLARIMGHKLDLLTPWSADQSYAAQKVLGRRRDGMLEVLIAAASRERTDMLLRQLAGLEVQPAAVDVALPGTDQRSAGLDLLQRGADEKRGPRLLAILLWSVLIALGALVGLIGWQIYERHQLLREQTALSAGLEQRLADLPDLRNRIEALRAQARFFADDRNSRPSPLLVLEVLSRLLPDTVWLTEVTLDGTELSISGLAEDASALIPSVEGAPEFEQTRFLSPSTRVTVPDPNGGERQVERFALRAVVDPGAEAGL